MNRSDFRYMNQGRHLREPSLAEMNLLKPFHYAAEQKNRALLMLHGFASSPACYRLLFPQIQYYDAIICPVLPGHGDSIDALSESTAKDWYESAKNHCALICKEYEQVDVLGLSLGGILACKLSQEFSLHHLYLLAPALKLRMHIPLMLALTSLCKGLGFKQLRNVSGNIRHPWHTELSYSQLPLTSIGEILTLIQQHVWQPPTCPVDLFLGAHDVIVDSFAVEQLFMPLPQAKIHWLLNSDHVLPLDHDLEQISRQINQHNSPSR